MGFLTGNQQGYGGPQAGLVARGPLPAQAAPPDQRGLGQDTQPLPAQPFTPPQSGPVFQPFGPPTPPQFTPILNGLPDAHPLQGVAQLIGDHTNVLRSRLQAAHMFNGLAPEGNPSVASPLSIPRQTRATGHQNLAQLLARFHGYGGRVRT